MEIFKITTTLLGGLSLFLYGMKIMSESLQMAAGDSLRNTLSKATKNRFTGVLTGISITSIIQSSSATTVMLVSFVSAGIISLEQSIGIILGANIGTTITAWLVAIFGFKFKIALFALPAIFLGFFIRFFKNEKTTEIGDIILGFGILFFGLSLMKSSVSSFKEPLELFMRNYASISTIFHTLAAVGIGALVTMIIQSSSATMAITMTLCATGAISFPLACALVLGENIGTTITANIASLGASIEAKRAARIHMLFNVLGVIWVIFIFHSYFVPFIDMIVPGNPVFGKETVTDKEKLVTTFHLAAFHTTFNVANTLIFLPFTKKLAALVTKLFPGKDEQSGYHLKYISTALMNTPAININQARQEVHQMLQTVSEMFELTMNVFRKPDVKMGKIVEEIQHKENMVDLLEKDISEFLVKVAQNNISTEQSKEITALLHSVSYIERIGDHCERLLKLLRRKYDHKYTFSNDAALSILEIADKNKEIISLIEENLINAHNILPEARVIENRINELRKEMRKDHIQRLNEGKCEVKAGLVFIDLLTSFEKIGDHAFNVAEAISKELL